MKIILIILQYKKKLITLKRQLIKEMNKKKKFERRFSKLDSYLFQILILFFLERKEIMFDVP